MEIKERVRNCKDIGENFQKIVSRLMTNDDLIKLLYYTDKDPLSQPNLTSEQKKELIFEKLIRIIPKVGPKETATSLIAIRIVSGKKNSDNTEFKDLLVAIEVFVPLTQWIIKNENLRPFAILGEIERSLNNKTINGLGKMIGGNFDLNFLTDEISCYEQTFELVSYA